MVPKILVANVIEMGFQTQSTKISNGKGLYWRLLLLNTRALEHRMKKFHCIAKTLEDIYLRKPIVLENYA